MRPFWFLWECFLPLIADHLKRGEYAIGGVGIILVPFVVVIDVVIMMAAVVLVPICWPFGRVAALFVKG